MKTALKTVARKLGSGKLISALLALTAVTVVGMSSVASAAHQPEYFAVEKPSSASQCYGGSWNWEWEWTWHRWHWQRHKVWFWTPNWERLGFVSRAHCLNYVTTPKPVSKQQCRQDAWGIGFLNTGHCIRYLRLHPGGGYGGGGEG